MKNPHAQALGSLGGKAGRGASKARTKEQASRAGKLGAQARWEKHTYKPIGTGDCWECGKPFHKHI